MATKKATSATKKPAKKAPAAPNATTTRVTTVSAVASQPANEPAALESPASKKSILSFNRRPLVAAAIAEFFGTFLLAMLVIQRQGDPITLFFGLIGIALMFGVLSGAYVNPAFTIAALITRRMKAVQALVYIVAQILGAMLAVVLLSMFASHITVPTGMGAENMMAQDVTKLFTASKLPEGKEWLALLTEIIGTAIFGFAVASATRERKERTAAALSVGLGIFIALMAIGSAAAQLGITAIFNPAVAVALQVDFLNGWGILVYVIGAIIGGTIGFALFDLLKNSQQARE